MLQCSSGRISSISATTAIHKKGRVDLCENYRRISLLNVWYKVYAALVHKRLVNAGAEEMYGTRCTLPLCMSGWSMLAQKSGCQKHSSVLAQNIRRSMPYSSYVDGWI